MASLSGHSSLAALCVACFSHRKASRAYDLEVFRFLCGLGLGAYDHIPLQ